MLTQSTSESRVQTVFNWLLEPGVVASAAAIVVPYVMGYDVTKPRKARPAPVPHPIGEAPLGDEQPVSVDEPEVLSAKEIKKHRTVYKEYAKAIASFYGRTEYGPGDEPFIFLTDRTNYGEAIAKYVQYECHRPLSPRGVRAQLPVYFGPLPDRSLGFQAFREHLENKVRKDFGDDFFPKKG